MSTTVKAGWLKDSQGNKFAPKTMSSQVIRNDGTILEDKINTDIAELREALANAGDKEHTHEIADVTGLQTELDSKVPITRTINGKSLAENITLSASDVGADASGSASSALAEAKQYTDTVASGKANTDHSHDDKYYTENEIDTKLASKSDTTHKHDSLYDASGSANSALSEAKSYADGLFSKSASSSHDHNTLYYTKEEINNMELITVGDIDTICGGNIQMASEVMF